MSFTARGGPAGVCPLQRQAAPECRTCSQRPAQPQRCRRRGHLQVVSVSPRLAPTAAAVASTADKRARRSSPAAPPRPSRTPRPAVLPAVKAHCLPGARASRRGLRGSRLLPPQAGIALRSAGGGCARRACPWCPPSRSCSWPSSCTCRRRARPRPSTSTSTRQASRCAGASVRTAGHLASLDPRLGRAWPPAAVAGGGGCTPPPRLPPRPSPARGAAQRGGDALGYESEAFAIHDLMCHCIRPPVYTVCIGNAFGEAAMLLAAGVKVHRMPQALAARLAG